MAPCLTIQSAGPGTTIQDGGRFGWLRFGVTSAGPMDWVAFETANRALGNVPDAAAIEIASGGITLMTDVPVILAFAGGSFAWTRDDHQLPPAARIRLQPGEILRARSGSWGAFAYCAVPGGLGVPTLMGSRATHTRSALGGLEGRMLCAGDRLVCLNDAADFDDVAIKAPYLSRSDRPLRIVLGPQDDYFSQATINEFLSATYKLTGAADRMAYKFEGPALNHSKDFNIVSDGVALGAIQVAGDAQPIILMADRQPTGGYAKIAHVCRADIGRLAQIRPGERCRFHAIDVELARMALLNLQDKVAETFWHMTPLRLTPSADRLLSANLVGGVTDGEL